MKRIGLTQRVEVSPHTGERRDCLDQQWAELLFSNGLVPVPLCNSVTTELDSYLHDLDLSGVVLTGGNDIQGSPGARTAAPERDQFELQLIPECLQRGTPILGVCRGMQILNKYFGGTVQPVSGHVRMEHTVRPTAAADSSIWAAEFRVMSYHDYGIQPGHLAPCLDVTALGDDGTVEAMRHRDKKSCHGVMWHPERPGPSHDNDVRILGRLLGATTQ